MATATRKKPRKITSGKRAVAKKVGRKAASKKAAAKKTTRKREPWGEFDEYGFRVGSDSSIIVHTLVEGGASRDDLNDKIAEALPSTKTRAGNEKNISSLVSGLLAKLTDQGYTVDSHWRLVPPSGKKTASNGASTKKPAKKAVAKKGRKKARR